MGSVCGKSPKVEAFLRPVVVQTEVTQECVEQPRKTYIPDMHQAKLSEFYPDYTIEPIKLGQGQYAAVYVARHQRSNTAKFAVKTMRGSAEDLDVQSAREAEVWSSLDHPFIAKYYQTFEDCSKMRHLLELCEGQNVISKLGYPPSMSEPDAKSIILQLVLAIRYLHLQGISHRDIKPDNIVYKLKDSLTNGWVKLVDFGLSKNVTTHGTLKSVVGSVHYVAPEVFDGDYDEFIDQWAIITISKGRKSIT